MIGLLSRLPSTMMLGTFATVFLIASLRHRSARIRLWAWAWALILLHLAFTLCQELSPSGWVEGCSYLTLIFAGIAFALSFTHLAQRMRERRTLTLILGTPAVFLSCGVALGPAYAWLSVLATAALFFGTTAWLAYRLKSRSLPMFLVYAAIAVLGALSIVASARGKVQFPIDATLMTLFAFSAISFLRSVRHKSTGRVLTFLGFVGWALAFAAAAFNPAWAKEVGEFWDVPKYFLGFGMVLHLSEIEKVTSDRIRESGRSLREQLETFSQITSRLLSGEDVRSLGNHIAEVITKVTTFQRVTILLTDEQQQMYLAGSAGVSEPELPLIEAAAARFSPAEWASVAEQRRLVGGSAFVFSPPQPTTTHDQQPESINPFWQSGDELLVPIRSSRGAFAGFFSLNNPRELRRMNSAEVSKLELLANDLGAAIDRAYLQREMVRTEKLAGVGQLVAGMAHELNNPLTAVLGYSEMLGELSDDPQVQQQAGVIQRESLRMKRIIDNLVRFAKQDKPERSLLSVNQTLDEVLKLWKSQAKASGIQMEVQIEKSLPRVRFDEAQLKQVFLNLLNNAYEAVADSDEKRISVSAAQNHGAVMITVSDTGSGFQDPERVFDPFFTTKAVGKGTGLGLSVCYGIVKQHGGDIRAFNTKPHGAGVTMEVPVAQQELALTM